MYIVQQATRAMSTLSTMRTLPVIYTNPLRLYIVVCVCNMYSDRLELGKILPITWIQVAYCLPLISHTHTHMYTHADVILNTQPDMSWTESQ